MWGPALYDARDSLRDGRLGMFDVTRQTSIQRRGVGWRAGILGRHRRRHGGLPDSGGKQRERRQLPQVGVFRTLETGDMGCAGETNER